MRARWRKLLSEPFLAGVGLAFILFILWQYVNHYFLMDYLMDQLDMSMLYYHYISLLAEIILASAIAFFASQAVAEKSRQIEDLSRQKDGLTDALVHDLRQPLTAVIGGLSSMAQDSDLPDTTRELVDIAHSGAEELLGMVNDLLDISRLDSGSPLLQPRPVRVASFVKRGVGRVAQLARERDQRLSVDVPEGLPMIQGDEERLSRVITNLVGNAIKFTPSKGEIRVSARAEEDNAKLLVSVSDTGPGIEAEFHHVIFDRFAVLEKSNPAGRTSTGLGLTFCKMIVEAHGGRIWVESEPGSGSTFTFSLPIAASAAAPPEEGSVAPSGSSGSRA